MIELLRVSWSNFLSTGSYVTAVDLSEARMTLICGDNGAGKSTIMDAICYALFGRAFRKISKTELINSTTNKNMLVEIEFNANGSSYIIRRGMKPSVFQIWCNGLLTNQDADSRDYQKLLEQNVLKIDYKTFTQKVIVGSANFTPFMQLNAADRRKVIEDLLDIQVFSQMNILLKSKANANKDAITDNYNAIALLQRTIDLYERHNKEQARNVLHTIEDKENKIKHYEQEEEQLTSEIASISSQLERLEEAYSGRARVQVLVDQKEAELRENKFRIHMQNERIQQLRHADNCPTCERALDHSWKGVADFETQVAQLVSAQEDLERAVRSAREKLDKFDAVKSKINQLHELALQKNNARILTSRTVDSLRREIEQLRKAEKEQIKSVDAEKQQLIELNVAKAQLLEERELLNVALMMMKDSGIKASIIRQYIPVINKLINGYLETMEFFCQFTVDENFEEKLRSRYTDDSSYEALSEGEKMRIDLALLFTWREIARMRNSSSVNLLIMDELMDSSLDASGTEDFLRIVQALSPHNNVIIISHKSDQISDKFERVIQFEKNKNFSRIKQSE